MEVETLGKAVMGSGKSGRMPFKKTRPLEEPIKKAEMEEQRSGKRSELEMVM